MDRIKEMEFLLENIPNFKDRYYDTILDSCEDAYLKDDTGLGYSHIVGFVCQALTNNETCIRAIGNIGKWDLLSDVADYYSFNVTEEMEKIFNEYNIEQIEKENIEEIINNKEKEENRKLYIYAGEKVIAINNSEGQAIVEEFENVDEAIAFLKINELDVVEEAKLIRKTNNETLDKMLIEKGYYDNTREDKVRQDYIENIYLGLKKYDDNSSIKKEDIAKLNYEKLHINSMKVDEIETIINRIKDEISFQLAKNQELQNQEITISYEM